MIDVFRLGLFFLNKPGYVYRDVMRQVFLCNLFGDHNQSEKCQARTAGNVFHEIVSDVNNQLICCEHLS